MSIVSTAEVQRAADDFARILRERYPDLAPVIPPTATFAARSDGTTTISVAVTLTAPAYAGRPAIPLREEKRA
jgi:hypothetical protein